MLLGCYSSLFKFGCRIGFQIERWQKQDLCCVLTRGELPGKQLGRSSLLVLMSPRDDELPNSVNSGQRAQKNSKYCEPLVDSQAAAGSARQIGQCLITQRKATYSFSTKVLLFCEVVVDKKPSLSYVQRAWPARTALTCLL